MKSLLRFVLNLSVLGVGIAAVGCSYDHTSTLPSTQTSSKPATTPSTGAGTGSFIGTWSDAQTAGTPSVTGCGNFTWAISSQTAQNVAGTFSFSCAGNITVNATATGIMTGSTSADLTVTGTGNVNGTNCDLSVAGTATFTDDTLSFPYTGTTCYGPVRGTETLQRKSSTPPPPPPPDPTPDPTPPPPPPPPPASFDLGQSIILNSPYDLASWPITSTISDLNIGPNGIHVEFSKRDGPGRWPDVFPPGWDEPLQYTLGMCLNISGQWYCSAVTQFWYGLDRSGGPPSQYANNWFYDANRWAPMTGHQPAVGETIGFFVCAGNCRNNTRGDNSTVKERTNVVLVPMPSDAGADYPQSAAKTIRRR